MGSLIPPRSLKSTVYSQSDVIQRKLQGSKLNSNSLILDSNLYQSLRLQKVNEIEIPSNSLVTY